MQAQVKRMNEVGDTVFLTPTPLLSYDGRTSGYLLTLGGVTSSLNQPTYITQSCRLDKPKASSDALVVHYKCNLAWGDVGLLGGVTSSLNQPTFFTWRFYEVSSKLSSWRDVFFHS
ncbi:MAG: hypothetical protein ACTH5C_20165 [Pseudoalteromonas prydzensis]|uniref:hypothetical protein n=1 Tax=Pseudoalteromonas prydzensis TaxID=182141 RepID=UPI003F94884B